MRLITCCLKSSWLFLRSDIFCWLRTGIFRLSYRWIINNTCVFIIVFCKAILVTFLSCWWLTGGRFIFVVGGSVSRSLSLWRWVRLKRFCDIIGLILINRGVYILFCGRCLTWRRSESVCLCRRRVMISFGLRMGRCSVEIISRWRTKSRRTRWRMRTSCWSTTQHKNLMNILKRWVLLRLHTVLRFSRR